MLGEMLSCFLLHVEFWKGTLMVDASLKQGVGRSLDDLLNSLLALLFCNSDTL